MIYELDKKDFNKIYNLLKGDLINLEIKAVAYGYNLGWIFVDNIKDPKTAIVWSRGIEVFYFVGKEDNLNFNESINSFIDKKITLRLKS